MGAELSFEKSNFRNNSVLGDIMNGNQAQAGNQKAGNQNAGNQGWFLPYLYFGMIIALVVGFSLKFAQLEREFKAANDPKLFEKFDVQHDLWKTLISAQDDPTNIEKEYNEKFNTTYAYLKAKSYVATHGKEIKTDLADDFSHFSTKMVNETQKILANTFGIWDIYDYHSRSAVMRIAKTIIEKNESPEALTFRTYMKKMQEAYVKRVIEVFRLSPEDLDTTPEYFCEVLRFCKFLIRPTNIDIPDDQLEALISEQVDLDMFGVQLLTNIKFETAIPDDLWEALISDQIDSKKFAEQIAKNIEIKVAGGLLKAYISDQVKTIDLEKSNEKIDPYFIKAKSYVLYAQRDNNGWNFDNLYIDQMIKFVNEENTSAEPLNFETYMKKLQEAYVKEVIGLFHLHPGHLDSTPEYFCEVFGFCEFLKKSTSSDTTPESKITAGEI